MAVKLTAPAPLVGSVLGGTLRMTAAPQIVDSAVTPMPDENRLGGGRDPAFPLPQYFADGRRGRIAFFDSGDTRSGAAPVLFIHGLAANLTHWVHVAPAVAESHRVIGLDMLGCGETVRPTRPYGLDDLVLEALDLLDALDIERVSLVGHSLGGMMSTAFACAHPDRVERIVLVNPGGMLQMPAPVRLAGHAFLRPWFLNPVLPRTWQLLLNKIIFHHPTPTTERFIRVCDETYDPADIVHVSAMIANMRRDLLERELASALDEIDAPIWLVWGENDRLVPAYEFRKLARRLPPYRTLGIPECGHMPNLECPEVITRFVMRALTE